jgi:hypothetical protein
MGIGNGITRGYGALYGMFNPKSFQFDLEELDDKIEEKDTEEKMAFAESELEGVSMKDVPKPRRNRVKKETIDKKPEKKPVKKLDKKTEKKTETKPRKKPVRKKPVRKSSKKVLTEEFDIEVEDSFSELDVSEDAAPEDARFNSPEFHKKQHKL